MVSVVEDTVRVVPTSHKIKNPISLFEKTQQLVPTTQDHTQLKRNVLKDVLILESDP